MKKKIKLISITLILSLFFSTTVVYGSNTNFKITNNNSFLPELAEKLEEKEKSSEIFSFPLEEISNIIYEDIVIGNINFYSKPDLKSPFVVLEEGTKVKIIESIEGEWHKIEVGKNIGYVTSSYIAFLSDDYVEEEKFEDTVEKKSVIRITRVRTSNQTSNNQVSNTTSNNEKILSSNSSVDNIINIGKNYIGVPYSYGAKTGDTSKFDCSSFTQYVYAKNGVNLNRTSRGQVLQGSKISKNELQKGDLVFFSNEDGKGIGHVAIYIGNDKLLHATTSKGVTISNLSNSYWSSHYITSRRIIN